MASHVDTHQTAISQNPRIPAVISEMWVKSHKSLGEAGPAPHEGSGRF
jgi:hypothetical protein